MTSTPGSQYVDRRPVTGGPSGRPAYGFFTPTTIPGLALVCLEKTGWTITHVPSGTQLFGTFAGYRGLVQALERLAHVDWDRPGDVVAADPVAKVAVSAAKDLLQRVGSL